MGALKKLLKKLLYREKCDSETYVNSLRKKGVKIGENVCFFSLNNVHVDDLNPHLLQIGNNVNIVGSEILTHDYAWSVIKGISGEILGNQKKVVIGDNVFIGHGSVILCGTTIENNVIIGANSVVTGHIEANGVYAGNPIRKIMSIEEYTSKRRNRQFEEAKNVVINYKNRFNKLPDKGILHEYFFLFTEYSENIDAVFKNKLELCGTYNKSCECLKSRKPMFSDYEAFLKACLERG